MRIPLRDSALAPTAEEGENLEWLKKEDNWHHRAEFVGVDDPAVRARLLANRDRADLHLTCCAALLFLLFTVILFSLPGQTHNFAYDNDMQPAICVVLSQQLEYINDAEVDVPPDVDIPVPLKWRGELRVHVNPSLDKDTQPFDAIALHTVIPCAHIPCTLSTMKSFYCGQFLCTFVRRR